MIDMENEKLSHFEEMALPIEGIPTGLRYICRKTDAGSVAYVQYPNGDISAHKVNFDGRKKWISVDCVEYFPGGDANLDFLLRFGRVAGKEIELEESTLLTGGYC